MWSSISTEIRLGMNKAFIRFIMSSYGRLSTEVMMVVIFKATLGVSPKDIICVSLLWLSDVEMSTYQNTFGGWKQLYFACSD